MSDRRRLALIMAAMVSASAVPMMPDVLTVHEKVNVKNEIKKAKYRRKVKMARKQRLGINK